METYQKQPSNSHVTPNYLACPASIVLRDKQAHVFRNECLTWRDGSAQVGGRLSRWTIVSQPVVTICRGERQGFMSGAGFIPGM